MQLFWEVIRHLLQIAAGFFIGVSFFDYCRLSLIEAEALKLPLPRGAVTTYMAVLILALSIVVFL